MAITIKLQTPTPVPHTTPSPSKTLQGDDKQRQTGDDKVEESTASQTHQDLDSNPKAQRDRSK
jgi:hypothetical protein